MPASHRSFSGSSAVAATLVFAAICCVWSGASTRVHPTLSTTTPEAPTEQTVVKVGAPGAGERGSATRAESLTPPQVRQKLFGNGSFKGTQPAGDWCVDSARLHPCPSLRDRFEYYLMGLGEVSIEEIRSLVDDEARSAHGTRIATQIMLVWDGYWRLRTHPWRNRIDQADRSTWLPSFEEQRMVRRQLLGAKWAKVFFEDDDRHFTDILSRQSSGESAPADPGDPIPVASLLKDASAVHAERVERYGQAAAARLAIVDAEWADWSRRLDGARAEWASLNADSSMSALQRRQAMESHVRANFKTTEYIRVHALLNL